MKINLGCGNKLLEDYVNVDLYAPGAIQADILTWKPDGLADEVLAIHVVEHLRRDQVVPFLRHVRSYLAPGGKLIVEMPDREKCLSLLRDDWSWRAGILGLMGDRTGDPVLFGDWVKWREANRDAITDAVESLDFASIHGMIPDQFRLPGQQHEHIWTEAEFAAACHEAGQFWVTCSDPLFHGQRNYRDARWVAERTDNV
jgi:hypothetical protein